MIVDGRARVLGLALSAMACGGSSCSDESANEQTPTSASSSGGEEQSSTTATETGPRPDVGLPPHSSAHPTTLRIINERSEPIRLVISFGEGQPFELLTEDGEPRFGLGGSGPLIEGDSCDCRCGYECLQCEPPELREHMVAPGEHFDFDWSGRARYYDGGCFEPYGAPPGPRRFKACLDDLNVNERDCVEVEATLPTDLIEFRFASAA